MISIVSLAQAYFIDIKSSQVNCFFNRLAKIVFCRHHRVVVRFLWKCYIESFYYENIGKLKLTNQANWDNRKLGLQLLSLHDAIIQLGKTVRMSTSYYVNILLSSCKILSLLHQIVVLKMCNLGIFLSFLSSFFKLLVGCPN